MVFNVKESKNRPEMSVRFVTKAVVWFIATAAGGVWISTFISGCIP